MAPHFIFEMNRVTKKFGEKTILQNISLSFYYGAKIGVVGENGAGKSTLLKIMAQIRVTMTELKISDTTCFLPRNSDSGCNFWSWLKKVVTGILFSLSCQPKGAQQIHLPTT
ncbi:MAG: ATP-binding cassette domain-containing protein [Thermoguttaceae bacterium]|nr:ATP-binding cassette domain-containing protein [Thermoguttaceae bacterium]